MSKILHDDHNDDTKTIAIPSVFSENSRAKNRRQHLKKRTYKKKNVLVTINVKQHFLLFPKCFLSFLIQNLFFDSHFDLDWSKSSLFGKETKRNLKKRDILLIANIYAPFAFSPLARVCVNVFLFKSVKERSGVTIKSFPLIFHHKPFGPRKKMQKMLKTKQKKLEIMKSKDQEFNGNKTVTKKLICLKTLKKNCLTSAENLVFLKESVCPTNQIKVYNVRIVLFLCHKKFDNLYFSILMLTIENTFREKKNKCL